MGSRKISIQVGKGRGAKTRKRGSASFGGRFRGQDERGLASLAAAEARKAAEGGDAAAQCLMARACLQGAGAARDPEAAVRWYRLAAEQDSAGGWFGLFSCQLQGIGVPKDEAAAFRSCERAAELGSLDAAANMGLLLLQGTGCEADPARARRWLRKAAEQGSAEAMYNLSCQLFRDAEREAGEAGKAGEAGGVDGGSRQGGGEAMQWLVKAAEADLPEAVIGLARKLCQDGAPAGGAAEPGGWLERAADFGDAWACFELGKARWNAAQTREAKRDALARLRTAARAGLPLAEYMAGGLAAAGQAPGMSRREGLALLKKAAGHGVKQAAVLLELEEAGGAGKARGR